MNGDIEHLTNTVGILQNEVLRLNQAVTRLELHTSRRVIQVRDVSVIVASGLMGMASVMWMLQMLGVL